MISLLLLSIIALNSCSSDDDSVATPSVDTSLILDKWWFDSDDFAGDIYFNSNGTYEQRVNLFGNVLSGGGQWQWLDEANGIIKIDDLTGQLQAVSAIWLKLTNIQETTMTVQQSTDGENYSIEVFYQDADPNG